MKLTEITLNPLDWASEVLGYLKDLKKKKQLQKQAGDLDVLIAMVDQGSTPAAIHRAAKKRGITLPGQ